MTREELRAGLARLINEDGGVSVADNKVFDKLFDRLAAQSDGKDVRPHACQCSPAPIDSLL
jgi:hypothetical protein